ncbi:MAG: hypothetical protein ACFFC7_33180 [Candidatus Hermodarchaeota archaeon]
MATMEIFLKKVKWGRCSKCSAEWPLKVEMPIQCPRCHNPLKKRIIPEELRHLIKPTRKDIPIYAKNSQKKKFTS